MTHVTISNDPSTLGPEEILFRQAPGRLELAERVADGRPWGCESPHPPGAETPQHRVSEGASASPSDRRR